MALPESRRHDLYNGLNRLLGTELADTLMAYLPSSPAADLATQDDIALIRLDIELLRDEVTGLRSDFNDLRSELRDDIRQLGQRIDRMQLTLLAGFISMVIALVVAVFFG